MKPLSKFPPLQHFFNGVWVDAENGAVFDVMNPLDHGLHVQDAKGTDVDIPKTVCAAKAAFAIYGETLPKERERWQLRVAEIMEDRKSELLGWLVDDALTSHKDVDCVTFTGSTLVGQHINEICAKNKTPNTLEFGSKSPTVILADAGLDKAMPLVARSIFMFGGQACIGSSRFYVKRALFDKFVKRFSMIASKAGMGDLRDPTTVIAPIISDRQRQRVKDHIADPAAKGATIAVGGDWQGNRCQPTLLTGVTEEMTVCRTETFGPVASIYPIDSYEKCLEKANDTEYGLSSATFTTDRRLVPPKCALRWWKKGWIGKVSISTISKANSSIRPI